MLGLLLTVAVTAGTPQNSLVKEREQMVGYLHQLQADTDEVSAYIRSGFGTYANYPQTGMIVHSAPEPGPDKLHPVIVLAVYGNGPAAQTGIKPGDRIVAIGPRRLEHETGDIARMLLDGTVGPIALTLRRTGTTDFTVTVQRTNLPCIQQAAQTIDQTKWLERIAVIRERSSYLLKVIADQPENPVVLSQTGKELLTLLKVAGDMNEVLADELFTNTRTHCNVQFE